MRILALGDPHGILPKNLNSLIKKNGIELIICVGDWGFTPEKPWLKKSWKGKTGNYVTKTAKSVLLKLDSYNIPILSLRGNMFLGGGKKIMDKFLKKCKNLIQKYTGKYKFHNQNFILFDISYEPETLMKRHKQNPVTLKRMKRLKTREQKLNKLLKENSDSILICHNPPYGYVDKAYKGKHVGSKILLNAIKKYKPKLVLCGHIHEAKGKAKIGETKIYNLGWHGDYTIFDVGQKVKLVKSNFLK